MTNMPDNGSVSRRTALTAFGAAGLGLTLAVRSPGALAKEATPGAATPIVDYLPAITHQVNGVWEIDVDNSCRGCAIFHGIFSAGGPVDTQGTFVGGDEVSVSIGEWRPTGERTVELGFINQGIDQAQAHDLLDTSLKPHGTVLVTPHLEYWRASLTLDQSGKTMTSTGYFQGYDEHGDPGFNSGEMVMHWTRMIDDPEAAFATPIS